MLAGTRATARIAVALVQRYSVAFHEAAHAVAALDLECEVASAAVTKSGLRGHTAIRFACDDPVDAAVVSLAGPAATSFLTEVLFPVIAPRLERRAPGAWLAVVLAGSSEDPLARVDYEIAACALRGHLGPCGRAHRGLGAALDGATQRARELVASRAGAIVDLADALMERGRLSGRDVARIVGRRRAGRDRIGAREVGRVACQLAA
jgi:hypothetical protein